MKNLLLLIITLPLFAFSQEMQIGLKSGSHITFNPQIVDQGRQGLDSLNSGLYDVLSVSLQNDSVLNIVIQDMVNNMILMDRMIVKTFGDTIKTTPDPVIANCLNTCRADDCVGGCYKKADCGCACSISGGCSDKWLAITLNMTFGALTRYRILTYYGRSIPEN